MSENSVGEMASSGVAWPRDAKPASPGAVGSALHSKPGLNFPFADRLVLVLVRITIQNGNSGFIVITLKTTLHGGRVHIRKSRIKYGSSVEAGGADQVVS